MAARLKSVVAFGVGINTSRLISGGLIKLLYFDELSKVAGVKLQKAGCNSQLLGEH